MIEKIISGGQTGADQAALDAAIKLGIWKEPDQIAQSPLLSIKTP